MLPTAVGFLSVSCLKRPTPSSNSADYIEIPRFVFHYTTLQLLCNMGCFICQKKQDFLAYMGTRARKCQLWFGSFLIISFFGGKKKVECQSAALLN